MVGSWTCIYLYIFWIWKHWWGEIWSSENIPLSENHGLNTLAVPLSFGKPSYPMASLDLTFISFSVKRPYLALQNLSSFPPWLYPPPFFFFFNIWEFLKIFLEGIWFIMLCEFQVHSKVNPLYTYIYPFCFRFSIRTEYRVLSRVRCAVGPYWL